VITDQEEYLLTKRGNIEQSLFRIGNLSILLAKKCLLFSRKGPDTRRTNTFFVKAFSLRPSPIFNMSDSPEELAAKIKEGRSRWGGGFDTQDDNVTINEINEFVEFKILEYEIEVFRDVDLWEVYKDDSRPFLFRASEHVLTPTYANFEISYDGRCLDTEAEQYKYT
jgi:hypothetical protein